MSMETYAGAAGVGADPRGDTFFKSVYRDVSAAASRLTLSTSPRENLRKLREYRLSRSERFKFGVMIVLAMFSMVVIEEPKLPFKILVTALYTLALLLPITSQFILPASPILLWLLLFYSCRFIPASTRPHIWVSVLPTLETIWYGANISDVLTQFGHPLLDILAWIPYGVVHFIAPFVVAAFIFVYAPPGSVKFFANTFGFINLTGVLIQIAFPCAPPWYELREGLTPANYGMRGSPAGLARIDDLFHSHGYTLTFTGAPMVFGAFPSLHAAAATCESLFCSYFFPYTIRLGRVRFDVRVLYWGYTFWLYWCTMYLMHHYLIDLVAGGCLATMFFYLFRTEEIRAVVEQQEAARERAERGSNAPPAAIEADAMQLDRLSPSDDKKHRVSGESSGMPKRLEDIEAGTSTASASSSGTPIFAIGDSADPAPTAAHRADHP